MTPERLSEIEARAEAAWNAGNDTVVTTVALECYMDRWRSHYRTDIPDLIAEVKRLREELWRAKATRRVIPCLVRLAKIGGNMTRVVQLPHGFDESKEFAMVEIEEDNQG